MNKIDKIKLLLQTTNLNRRQEGRFKGLLAALPVDLVPKLGTIKAKFLKKIDGFTENAIDRQVELYDKLLSEAAIEASLLFYSSKEGQEVVNKLPAINEGLSALTIEFTTRVMSELFEEIKGANLTDEELETIGMLRIPMPEEDSDEEEEEASEKVDVEDNDGTDLEQFFKKYGFDQD